jgi:hypothetical protein
LRRFISEWATASCPLSLLRWVLLCGELSAANPIDELHFRA